MKDYITALAEDITAAIRTECADMAENLEYSEDDIFDDVMEMLCSDIEPLAEALTDRMDGFMEADRPLTATALAEVKRLMDWRKS